MRSKAPKSDPDGTAARPADGGSSVKLRQAAGEKTSRRHMLRRGGTVAVATVAGLTLLDQRRAEAGNGANFILGSLNDANATTELHVTTPGTKVVPLFHLNGSALSSTSTTAVIDGPPSPFGVGLIVNAPAGAQGVHVNASSTSKTTGLAIAATGGGTAGGVKGVSTGVGAGVAGASSTGPGVVGSGARGGDFSGKAAAIRLRPSTAATHPASGKPGDLFVTSGHSLFFCKGGTTWVKLA